MTRLWAIPPKYLCDHTDGRTDNNHLLGEHSEMHQEAGTIANHPHGRAVARGHAKLAQVDTAFIVRRHDTLAAELTRRGFDHDSPLDYGVDWEHYDHIGYVDPHANFAELYDRCADCAARMDEHGGFK